MRHRHAVLVFVSLWISATTFAEEAVAEDAPITIEYGPTDDPPPVTVSTGRSADGLTLNLSIHLNLPGRETSGGCGSTRPPAVRRTEAQGWGPGEDGDGGGRGHSDEGTTPDPANEPGTSMSTRTTSPPRSRRPRPYDPPAEAPRSRRTRRARAEAARYDTERDAASGWERRSPAPAEPPSDAGDEVPAEASGPRQHVLPQIRTPAGPPAGGRAPRRSPGTSRSRRA